MTGLRRLPIRVPPLPGEALDSWSEALAARLLTPLGHVLWSLGLGTPPRRKSEDSPRDIPADWTIMLRPHESERLAFAAGLEPHQVDCMTLAAYQNKAVRIDADKREVNRRVLWGRGRGSRYCPECLAANGGRWPLMWRLSWSFACTIHHRLLADLCPCCGKVPRLRASSRHVVPRPGLCPAPTPREGFRSMSQRCGQPLHDADTMRLGGDHPAIRAQELLYETIDSGIARFGTYAAHPQQAVDALTDVKIIAARVISDPDLAHLRPLVPPDLFEACLTLAFSPKPGVHQRPGFMAPPHAITTALGTTAALGILGRDDIQRAGDSLRTLILPQDGASPTTDATTLKNQVSRFSPVLRAVRLAALSPSLHIVTQLRHRTASSSPAPPVTRDATALALARARHIPSMLWTSWAVRLRPPSGVHQEVVRSALSSALLTIGTPITLGAAAGMLGRATDSITISRILQLLHSDPHWEHIHIALDRLAAYLDTHGAPIDYRRRRELDYSDLLTHEQWLELCAGIPLVPGRGRRRRIAHTVLFHRISGQPVEAAPEYIHQDREFTAQVAELAALQTPELADALDIVARAFLAHHGISGEPVGWQPPPSLIADLNLPGPDPSTIDTPHLHRLIRDEQLSPRRAAAHLGIPLGAIRHVLQENPAPANALAAAQARTPGWARHQARSALPIERLRDLYEEQGLSVARIAELAGVSKQTVTRLADDYGIARRGILQSRTIHTRSVDRDWLWKEYVEDRRSLESIARDSGMSATTLRRQAGKLGIPLRARGGSHQAQGGTVSTVKPAATPAPTT